MAYLDHPPTKPARKHIKQYLLGDTERVTSIQGIWNCHNLGDHWQLNANKLWKLVTMISVVKKQCRWPGTWPFKNPCDWTKTEAMDDEPGSSYSGNNADLHMHKPKTRPVNHSKFWNALFHSQCWNCSHFKMQRFSKIGAQVCNLRKLVHAAIRCHPGGHLGVEISIWELFYWGIAFFWQIPLKRKERKSIRQ